MDTDAVTKHEYARPDFQTRIFFRSLFLLVIDADSSRPRGARDCSIHQPSTQARPDFSSRLRTSRIRRFTVGLIASRVTVECRRRIQFEFAAVPGTLKRSFRPSRSVIMMIAIQDSLRK